MTLPHWPGLAAASLALASLAPAQRFGFTHQMVPAEGVFTSAVALGDVDGDGDLDALLGSGQTRLYLNDGTGVLTDVTAMNLPVLLNSTAEVALGDVDGDGDLDAFIGSAGFCLFGLGCFGAQDRLYLNGGTGVFADATSSNLPPLLAMTSAVAFGDVDGDGDLDAYVGRVDQIPGSGLLGGQNRLYLNGGTGGFADVSATNLPVLVDPTVEVEFGDVDADGDLDVVVGNYQDQDRLYVNGGTGVFTDVTAANLPVLADPTNALALGDVDGDGDLDAFFGNVGGGRLYANGGAGTFIDVSAASLPASALTYTRALTLGDLDGDGDLDSYLGSIFQDRLYLNGGTGLFTDATPTNLPPLLDDDTYSVAAGDMDGDGDLDVLVGNGRAQDRLHLNAGSGAFTDATGSLLPPSYYNTQTAALGDVDGDGDLDAFVGYRDLDRLHLNDGTGVFADVTSTNLPALLNDTTAIALGDVDGDGDLDAFLGSGVCCSGTRDRLYLNDGTGVFADLTTTNLPTLVDITRAVALGDVDVDGDLDAFLGCDFQDRLYVNDGTAVFTDLSAANIPGSPDNTSSAALGDVDGDGDLDAFLGSDTYTFVGGQDRLYVNDGTGVFTDVTAPSLPALLDWTLAVALGDVDGDGDLDAFVGNGGTTGLNRLYLNNGTGTFADLTSTNVPALVGDTEAVALGDVDGDGDLDAFLGMYGAAYFGGQDRLYANDGTGVFADATSTDLPALDDDTRGVALGDVDGDGDLDALTANEWQNRLYVNLTRQLGWRGVPRAGKPLTLDVRGPANGFWILGASAASASIPLPYLGTLRLDPTSFLFVAAGSLDTAGRANLSFLVPANPALVGLSAYFQAGVGPPPILTNLEIATVSYL